MPKTITTLTDELYLYMLSNWLRESDLQKALREETACLAEFSSMQISPDQAQFMAFVVQLMDAQNILEIGTFTGYSALAMALASGSTTQIICCDINKDWTDIGRNYWRHAGVENKIKLKLAPALETLQELLLYQQNRFDFIFIDTDKSNYDAYYEACLQLVRPGGVIAIDNVFWGGWAADLLQQDEDTIAIRALNKKLHSDQRIDLSIVPIGDGLTLARKRHLSD